MPLSPPDNWFGKLSTESMFSHTPSELTLFVLLLLLLFKSIQQHQGPSLLWLVGQLLTHSASQIPKTKRVAMPTASHSHSEIPTVPHRLFPSPTSPSARDPMSHFHLLRRAPLVTTTSDRTGNRSFLAPTFHFENFPRDHLKSRRIRRVPRGKTRRGVASGSRPAPGSINPLFNFLRFKSRFISLSLCNAPPPPHPHACAPFASSCTRLLLTNDHQRFQFLFFLILSSPFLPPF